MTACCLDRQGRGNGRRSHVFVEALARELAPRPW
jgi:hypothetical protein